MLERLKTHKLNPKTNRMKNFRTRKYLFTDIPPEQRTFKNLPRYANKKPKVRFQDWLEIDAQKRQPDHTALSWGWDKANRCWGWSHRAVHGAKIGDIVKPGDIGNPDNKTFTLKTREDVENYAKAFADDVS
jgi:hypothetical protein